jgi:hypothetical protein
MRIGIITLCALLVGFVASCKSESTPAKSPTTGDKSAFVVTSGGAPVLSLTLPAGAQGYNIARTDKAAEMAKIASEKDLHRFYVWVVPNAKTVGDAVAQVPDIIKSEFLEFKVAGTKDASVNESPATQVEGDGKEADDGDPGAAYVVLFQMGGHVFAACVHGEGDAPTLHRPFMQSVLDTARVP